MILILIKSLKMKMVFIYENLKTFETYITEDFNINDFIEDFDGDEEEFRDKFDDYFNEHLDNFCSSSSIKECKQIIGNNGGLYRTLKYIINDLGIDNILNLDEENKFWRSNLYFNIEMNFKEEWFNKAYELYLDTLNED